MSETTEPRLLGPEISLYHHALRLHRRDPEAPLPHHGKPFPHRHRSSDEDMRSRGAAVAAILDRHFADPDAVPAHLAEAFHDVPVPIHRTEHVAAAALRADRARVQATGRWLVRNCMDQCGALAGLALLAEEWERDEEDIDLIMTIGLLSDTFGPLAAHALQRRGAYDALCRLADRTTGWGRVYLVESLCRYGSHRAREWLLRHSCDGDFLNGYFAYQVATATHLHEAITVDEVDGELLDNTGRLLHTLTYCGGMSLGLADYPPARQVLAAYAGHLGRQEPTWGRFVDAAGVALHLLQVPAERAGLPAEAADLLAERLLAVLNRADWCATAREARAAGNEHTKWFAKSVAQPLRLRAFGQGVLDESE